jgi:hypothetical protein
MGYSGIYFLKILVFFCRTSRPPLVSASFQPGFLERCEAENVQLQQELLEMREVLEAHHLDKVPMDRWMAVAWGWLGGCGEIWLEFGG